jgi:hypothetical protein
VTALRAEASRAREARVAEAPGLSRARLAWLLATRRPGWAVALWLCLAGAIAMPALLPLIDAMAVRSGLAQTLARDGALTVEQNVSDLNTFNKFERDVDARVSGRTGSALVPLAAYATVGPLHVVSVGSAPVAPNVAQQALTAAYSDHLASHVTVDAGSLPPDALGGGDTAVTMPQAAADRLGLRMSDRVCFDFTATPGTPRWCARIVGFWQPLDAKDPYWGQAPNSLQLTMGRFDFFELVKQHPPQGPTARLRYWASSDAVDPAKAAVVAGQVRRLTAELKTPERRLTTSLGPSLDSFHTMQVQVSTAIHLFAAAMTLLGLFVVALVGARFLDREARELAVLRARGWPSGRVWRTAFSGLATLTLCALPVGVAAGLLFVAVLSLIGSGISPGWLHQEDVTGVAAAMIANLIGLLALLGLLAAGAARRELDPSLEAPFRNASAWWQRAGTALILGFAGLIELALPRLPWTSGLTRHAPDPLPTLLGLAPAVGLILLTAAVIHLWPLGWAVRPSSVAGALAGWQLKRSPEQHSAASFVMILAVAIGVFAAIGLGIGPEPQVTSTQPALGAGLGAGLLVGALIALALALAAFGLHFRSTAWRRFQEYSGMLAHGLATADVTRSVATEQASVTMSALVVGSLLGLALALAGLPLARPTWLTLQVAAASLGSALVCLFVAMLVAGSAARRLPAHANPFDSQGQP